MSEKSSFFQFWLVVASFLLAVFVTPFATILNQVFAGGYIYFAALPDVLIILLLILNTKNLIKFSKTKLANLDYILFGYLCLSLIYVLISILQKQNFVATGQGFLTAARFSIVYFVFRFSSAKFELSRLRKPAILTLSLIIIFGLIQFFYPELLNLIGYNESPVKAFSTVDGTWLVRVQSLLRGPNPYGAFLLLPLSLMLFKFNEIRNKRFGLVLIISIIFSLVLTWSRSAWLGAVVIILVWLVSKFSFKLNKKMLTGGAMASFFLIIAFFFVVKTDSFKTVFLHDKPGVGGTTTSDQDRIESYKNALSLIAKNPLGLGISNAGPASIRSNKGVKIVENYYLQVGLQMGWVGLGILVLTSLTVLLILFKARDNYGRSILASFLALNLVGLMQPVWADVSVTVCWWSLFSLWLHNREKNVV